MRLGSYTANLKGKVKEIYGKEKVSERHRHRYEVNPKYHEQLKENGLKLSSFNEEMDNLVEFIELPNKEFFIGTQAHPEFNSTFENPNPLYTEFLKKSK